MSTAQGIGAIGLGLLFPNSLWMPAIGGGIGALTYYFAMRFFPAYSKWIIPNILFLFIAIANIIAIYWGWDLYKYVIFEYLDAENWSFHEDLEKSMESLSPGEMGDWEALGISWLMAVLHGFSLFVRIVFTFYVLMAIAIIIRYSIIVAINIFKAPFLK